MITKGERNSDRFNGSWFWFELVPVLYFHFQP